MNLSRQISLGRNILAILVLFTSFFISHKVQAQCAFPVVSALSQNGGTCPGDTRTLSVFGSLNDATQWTWYITICGGPIVVGTGSSVQVHPTVTATYYVKGTGGCVGTQASCASLLVSVIDNDPPFALCQTELTVHPDSFGIATITAEDLDVGSLDFCGPVTLSASPTQFQCYDFSIATLTVTDGSGNVDSCTVPIRFEDNLGPVVTCKDYTYYLGDSTHPQNNLIPVDSMIDYLYDNCGIIATTVNPFFASCVNLGEHTAIVTAQDVNQTSQCTAQLTILDTVSPTINCPANLTLVYYLDTMPNAPVPDIDIFYSVTDNCFIDSLGVYPETLFCGHNSPQNILVTAFDFSGNNSRCTFEVDVRDTTAPVALCKDITVYLEDDGNVSVGAHEVDNGSYDNCDIRTMSVYPYFFECDDQLLPNFVTLRVYDPGGRTDSCTAVITVVDTTTPYISCVDDTFYIPMFGGPVILSVESLVDSLSDNCSLRLSPSTHVFFCSDLGNNPVTITADNPIGSGPPASCTAVVTVLDTTPPLLFCHPFDVEVYLDSNGLAHILPEAVTGTLNDNCAIDTAWVIPSILTCKGLGSKATVLVTAVDESGNTSTCSASVLVVDTVPPVAGCKNVTVYLNASGKATLSPLQANDGSTDNCKIASLSVSPNTFDCGDLGGKSVGTSTATLTVTDASGNSGDCTFLVFVEDTLAPTITCPSSRKVSTDPGTCDAVVLYPDPVAVDNCPIVSSLLVEGLASGSTFPIGLTSVKYVAFDTELNLDSCRFTVLVEDREKPVVTCPSDTTLIANTACEATYTGPLATVSDNCPGVNLITKPFLPATFSGAGTYAINYTAVDAVGNSNGCLQTITVVSSVVADAGDDLYLIINSGNGTDPKPCDTLFASASGGSGSYTYSWLPTTGLSDPSSATTEVCATESTTYYFTATDASGCSATDTVFVEVVDLDTDTLPTVGNNNNKVYVCDLTTCTTIEANANANCASPTSLCYLLSNGAVLGECTCKTATNNEPENGLRLLAFPNPFTSRTTIQFSDGKTGHATLEVFDLKGSVVASLFNGEIEAGRNYRFEFDASHLSQQMFIARITTHTKVEYLKILLLK